MREQLKLFTTTQDSVGIKNSADSGRNYLKRAKREQKAAGLWMVPFSPLIAKKETFLQGLIVTGMFEAMALAGIYSVFKDWRNDKKRISKEKNLEINRAGGVVFDLGKDQFTEPFKLPVKLPQEQLIFEQIS